MDYIIKLIPRILSSPEFKKEEDTRIARIVHLLCLMIIVGFVLASIHSIIDREWKAVMVLTAGVGCILFTLLLISMRLLNWSTRALVLTVLGTATALICISPQGIHDVVIMVYPGSLVVASQILNKRSFIAYTVVLILSVVGVLVAEMSHILVNEWSVLTKWSDLVDILIILIITAVVVEMMTESLRLSLMRTQLNEAALRSANLEMNRNAERLRKSEENYREIFNTSNDAIIVHDAKSGDILDVNQTALEMYGYTREELLKLGTNDLSLGNPPYSSEEANQWIRKAIETGSQVFGWRARRKDGELLWVEIALKSTNIGGEGRVMAVVRDITNKKKAEEELRESRQMLRSILDTISVRLFWKDLNLNFLGCNRSFAKDAGMSSPDEIIGKDDFAMVWNEQAKSYRADDWKVIQSGLPKIQYEEHQTTADGSKIWLRTTKAPLLDGEGNIRGVLGCYEDITEHKMLEAQLRQAQKMEAFGQLAGGVAHDFNNILTVILSNAALLEMQELSRDKVTQSLKQITHAAERAANLTRQLLTFSRRQILQLVDLDLNEVVGNMTKMLQRLIGENISLQAHYAAGSAPVYADPGMMEQVLMNLAVNSRDAMPKGGNLVLRTEVIQIGEDVILANPRARPGKFIRLGVYDTGKGIAPENMPRIFEPFFTTKEIGKGTGLGLATVFGIVEQHQGWIDVESEAGTGTAFHIYLPYRDEKIEEQPQKSILLDVPEGRETILVVEDEDPVRSLARNALELKGYLVYEARDARTAMEVWQQFKDSIDLLMTDLIMPGDCNGHELAAKLQAQKPALKVIFCSGYSDEVLGSDFALSQDLNFLQKPYNLSRLARMVRDCLDGTSIKPRQACLDFSADKH